MQFHFPNMMLRHPSVRILGPCSRPKRRSVSSLVETLLQSKQRNVDPWKFRLALSRAVTVIESQHANDRPLCHELLQTFPLQPNSFRIGITGSPGAGKSTLLESFLHQQSAAILCVDPSSPLSGGSILGDKTRMAELSKNPEMFIRPSPSIHSMNSQTDATCRFLTNFFELVFVETVGIGQSHSDISQAVDVLLYLVPPGLGDDVQAQKKGILELADLIVVTKADEEYGDLATRTAADYSHKKPVLLTSAKTGRGRKELWDFLKDTRTSASWLKKRAVQNEFWLHKHLQDQILQYLQTELQTRDLDDIRTGKIPPRVAADQLCTEYITSHKTKPKLK